jgi:fermentation-respiration switch protein FrsA (DUF1100 family)
MSFKSATVGQFKNRCIGIPCMITLLFLSSCSFNKAFLQPTVIPAGTRNLTMNFPTDTIYVSLEGDTYEPVFLKQRTDTIAMSFTIESVIFQSSSGNRLNGWMMKPKNVTPLVTLLHLHGNAGCLLSQHRSLVPLLEYGFQVFIFDYSGFGLSTGRATRENILKDANSALDYLKSREDVKGKKLVIYGQSLGGHLSAVVAAQRQDDIDALVVEGAFSSHRDIAARMAGLLGRMIVSEPYSAMESIEKFHKSVLVIHSTEDGVIPFFMGKKIYEHANEPKEFYEIKKPHICGPEFYAVSIASKITDMLNVNREENTGGAK